MRTRHEAHIACGDRCAAIKKHTDGTENTDRSFHGFFLIYPIDSLIDYMKIQRILSKLVSWFRL